MTTAPSRTQRKSKRRPPDRVAGGSRRPQPRRDREWQEWGRSLDQGTRLDPVLDWLDAHPLVMVASVLAGSALLLYVVGLVML